MRLTENGTDLQRMEGILNVLGNSCASGDTVQARAQLEAIKTGYSQYIPFEENDNIPQSYRVENAIMDLARNHTIDGREQRQLVIDLRSIS